MGVASKIVRAAVVAVAMMGGAATASTVNLTAQGSALFDDAAGMNKWVESSTFSLNGRTATRKAGLLRLTQTTASGKSTNFGAFYMQPFIRVQVPGPAHVGSTLGATQLGLLGALSKNAMSLVSNSRTAAAFQIAAWEIANETSQSLQLGSGIFQILNAKQATLSLAQSWLDMINNGAWKPNQRFAMLTSNLDKQDFLTDMAPVPLPAAGMMLLGALGGLTALRRRRKAA